jgi:hypothetical protein
LDTTKPAEKWRGYFVCLPPQSECSLFSRYLLHRPRPQATVDYRRWFHVNTMIVDKSSLLFEVLGGMHIVHVNSVGETALRKGGPYPKGTVLLIDLHEFSLVDGAYVEGALKGFAVMAKDSKKYAPTGGWGFQFWAQGDPKKPLVKDVVKECFECHQPKRAQDHVYSTYIP